ncbi:uncharacterized protein LOC129602593 [Paramacrobiotus metropolitanus]|uniref:uncharacterized protein LOC129602593 n=1 Tax=Paramacrobiotus metropolitanus TaxID=2943436 RepID=UPI0024461A34|nr:uncharacterized protein LOC129602593 [Paramacrobiotus metropolitanus]
MCRLTTDIIVLGVFMALRICSAARDNGDDDDSMGYSMPSRVKTPQLTLIDATCDASGMQVTIQFDMVFNGIIYSKGSYYTQGCVFIQANQNLNKFTFTIPINACGTQSGNDDTKSPPIRYIENTIIMQNDAMIQQLTDVARKVRCNWNSNFRNTITFTPFRVDMGIATSVNFNGDDVTTAMSVQVGRGPFAPVIAEGIVQIGDTLTLVIYLQTKDVTMEIQVLDCYATDGKNRNKIQLTDENGCVMKEKLISQWQTTRETQNTAAQIAYAYLTAFKFPDDYTVNIKCNIAVCKGGCPFKQCSGRNYGQVEPPPVVPDNSYKLHRRTTPAPPPVIPDDGYGPIKKLTPPPTTTTTTTTTTTRRRIVYPVETPEPPPYVPPRPPYVPPKIITPPPEEGYGPRPTPGPRRRTVFDRRRREAAEFGFNETLTTLSTVQSTGQIPLSSSIRVISPADVTSPQSLLRIAPQAGDSSTLCVNTVLFAFGIALIFALLVASCVTSALLCIRQRSISKSDKEVYEYDSSPLPDYPQK